IASVPSASPRARVTTSATFWRAKASHGRTSGSRACSASRSIGTCWSEQEGQGGQRPLEVVGPDVAAVDHPGDQGPAAEAAGGGQQLEVAGAVPGQVEADAVDRGAGEDPEGVAQVVEVAGDKQPGPGRGAAEAVVGT